MMKAISRSGGTPIPNVVFVGGIAPATSEVDLIHIFSNYGNVTGTKIISDRAGVSKGYAFVTFKTEEEAKGVLKANNIFLGQRGLNIAPAIKKQGFARGGVNVCSPEMPQGQNMRDNNVTYAFHNGTAFFDRRQETQSKHVHQEPSPVHQSDVAYDAVGPSPGPAYLHTGPYYASQSHVFNAGKQDHYHLNGIAGGRVEESSPGSTMPHSHIMHDNGVAYAYHNGTAFFERRRAPYGLYGSATHINHVQQEPLPVYQTGPTYGGVGPSPGPAYLHTGLYYAPQSQIFNAAQQHHYHFNGVAGGHVEDYSPETIMAQGQIMHENGVTYTFYNGMAFFERKEHTQINHVHQEPSPVNQSGAVGPNPGPPQSDISHNPPENQNNVHVGDRGVGGSSHKLLKDGELERPLTPPTTPHSKAAGVSAGTEDVVQSIQALAI